MNKRDLAQAGREFVGDWLCWHEKELAQLKTIDEKRNYIESVAFFESCARDMATAGGDTPANWSADAAADYIYSGMEAAIRKYLKSQQKLTLAQQKQGV